MTQAAFGISVFETVLGSLMSLVHNGRITLNTLIDKLTRQPALLLGERHGISGILEDGKPDDIVIIDPDKEWTVNTEEFVSKGKNTPLAGAILKGNVVMTISGGKIAYNEEQD